MPHRPRMIALGPAALALSTALADEKLAGIACRSVHLAYPAPEGDAFYTEVTVEKSAEGTYFCACGFDGGYFGIQEQGRGKKVAIFSVWDPGKQDDPNAVDPGSRVKLLAKGEKVRTGRFGNEGTGGQSFLDLDWKVGETYRFLVTAKVDGDRTAYAAYVALPEAKGWDHIATFSTLTKTKGKLLGGYYSFVEDFRRNKVSATIERRAKYGPGWVRDKEGRWVALARAKFTADSNPAKTIDAGVEAGHFFLATGGTVENAHVPLNGRMELPDLDPKASDRRPARILELP